MKILITASECAPYIKVGGIADVIGSLPEALIANDIDARVVIPYYKDLDKYFSNNNINPIFIGEFQTLFDGKKYKTELFILKNKFTIYFIKNLEYISNGGVYFNPEYMASLEAENLRFAYFSKSIIDIFLHRDSQFKPDIIHCNDWHTGIIPQILKTKYKFLPNRPKTIMTIHNLGYQGFSSLDVASKLGLSIKDNQLLHWDSQDDNLDFLMQGILSADLITVVSPKYAQEIQTPEYGEGLHEVLQNKKDKIVGILNGIDLSLYNPNNDDNIYHKFSPDSVSSYKPENKSLLQNELNLNMVDKPIICIISRLVSQKGIDIVTECVFEIIDKGCQIVILGTGDPQLETILKSFNLNPKVNKDFKACIEFSNVMASKIYASSDFILIPSRYEPCGLTQMIAMRYGTLPIVRATGGLENSIIDKVDGIKFLNLDKQTLLSTIDQAVNIYRNKSILNNMIQNAMAKDFSWINSAKQYTNEYKRLLKLN